MSGTPVTPSKPVLADPADLERWLAQAVEVGWQNAREHPQSRRSPRVTVTWEQTNPALKAISPVVTLDPQ